MSGAVGSVGFEPSRARAYVWDVLHGDATLLALLAGGVHIGVAPDGAQPPYATLHVASAPDHTTANGVRVWSDPLVQVTLTGTLAQGATVEAAADRADTLLARTSGTSSRGGAILACVREDTQVLEPVAPDGTRYQQWHLEYRVPTQLLA